MGLELFPKSHRVDFQVRSRKIVDLQLDLGVGNSSPYLFVTLRGYKWNQMDRYVGFKLSVKELGSEKCVCECDPTMANGKHSHYRPTVDNAFFILHTQI